MASPAFAPAERRSLASATGSSHASAWKVTLYAPASAYPGAHRRGSSIIRCTSNGSCGGRPQALHHGQPDGQVRHEVVVHHVDVQPVRGVLDGADFFGEAGEIGGQDARRDDRRRYGHGASVRTRPPAARSAAPSGTPCDPAVTSGAELAAPDRRIRTKSQSATGRSTETRQHSNRDGHVCCTPGGGHAARGAATGRHLPGRADDATVARGAGAGRHGDGGCWPAACRAPGRR